MWLAAMELLQTGQLTYLKPLAVSSLRPSSSSALYTSGTAMYRDGVEDAEPGPRPAPARRLSARTSRTKRMPRVANLINDRLARLTSISRGGFRLPRGSGGWE